MIIDIEILGEGKVINEESFFKFTGLTKEKSKVKGYIKIVGGTE